MKGIEYVIDDSGNRKAVLIDLIEHGEFWEDFYDALLAQERADEPRETLAELKEKLGVTVE